MKSQILDLLERPVAGWPLRLLGCFSRGRQRLFGLTNPFFVPTLVAEIAGADFVAERESYLVANNWRNAVKLDPELFEPEISHLIGRLIKPDHIVLDVGANMGAHTVAFARRAHRGHVYAFEPVREMAVRLSHNCRLNGIDNVTLMRCGLGDRDDTLEMNVNVAGPAMEGTSSLTRTVHIESHPEWYETRTVPIRRLDDVVGELAPAGRIGFVKIDTEGFETQIIEGGMETLRRDRPVMIVEAHSRRLEAAGKSFQWYLDTFSDYHIFIVTAVTRANPYLRLEPLRGVQPEIAVNLLLLPALDSIE